MFASGYWCIRSGARFFFPQTNATVTPTTNTAHRTFYASLLTHLGTTTITATKNVIGNTSGCCTVQTFTLCSMGYGAATVVAT